VTRLAAGADVVLMDMRGFTRQHRGCIFELNTLMSHAPLTRLVIVVDESTSRPALDDVARAAWQQLRDVSMSAAVQGPALGLLDFSGRHAERRLFEFLAASASPISANPPLGQLP
jgi:hypothetical protein